jgi:transposase
MYDTVGKILFAHLDKTDKIHVIRRCTHSVRRRGGSMALHPKDFSAVPEETARVAHAAFPKGNPCLTLRDNLGDIYQDSTFASLFASSRGRPAESPACVALVTALQFAEELPDRAAADAVRGRIDWKYLLGLELTDAGFHYSVLSDFRKRVQEGGAERQLLDALLERLGQCGLIKERGQQRTDSTQVLAAIRELNRLECVGETLRYALNSLAVAAGGTRVVGSLRSAV